MKYKIRQKIFAFLLAFALILNSVGPFLRVAYAEDGDTTPTPEISQEVTPTPDNSTPTPTIEQPQPTDTPAPTPTVDEVTPTETVTPTPDEVSITPTPEEIPTVTVEPTPTVDPAQSSDNPSGSSSNEGSNTSDNNSSNDSNSTGNSNTPTVTPTPTSESITGNEQLNFVILENIAAPSIDLESVVSQGSASLTTDKTDYAPTDTVLLTGVNLNPNENYNLAITSDNQPAIHFETGVTSDANGIFVYAYQLDGNYRPDYKAELKDLIGIIVASTTFQDHCVYGCPPPSNPDLTAVKTNNVNGNAVVNSPFAWTIRVTNSGNATAIFNRNTTIFTDNLPSGPAYGSPSVATSGITGTGSISCSRNSNDIACTATGAPGSTVNFPAGSYFDLTINVTPATTGSLANPRTGSGSPKCQVDPNNNINNESNESNNNCQNSVTVTQPLGSIKIVKNSLPNNNADFTFDRNFGYDFSLEDNGNNYDGHPNNITFSDLNAGFYTITEHFNSDWKLTHITCTGTEHPYVNLYTRTVAIALEAGENAVCTFQNTKYSSIEGIKWNDVNGNGIRDQRCYFDRWGHDVDCYYTEPTLAGWTINLENMYGEILATDTTNFHGAYNFDWVLPGIYKVCEVQQDGWTVTHPWNNTCQMVFVGAGENKDEVNFGNQRSLVTISGYKWNDINGNHEKDEDEPTLADWTINLQADADGAPGEVIDTTTTDDNGNYTFTTTRGDYWICEVQQTGWAQTFPQEQGCWNITSQSVGEQSGLNFGNHISAPSLIISKLNDAGGNKGPGDVVNFTITISNAANAGEASNVRVIDLLPKGIRYNGGSWHALLNGSDLTLASEPAYASPGTWILPNMAGGDTITLTYSATIDNDQAAGTYYDSAWAQGTAADDPAVILATAGVDGNIGDPNFVGTQVTVEHENLPSSDYEVNVNKEVLGAATFLPETGENTLWLILATLTLTLGIGALVTGTKLKKHE